MKKINVCLTMSLCFLSVQLLSMNPTDAWKIRFFENYITGYKDIQGEPNHTKIATVLQQAFDSSEELIPESGQQEAEEVRDQVCFFSHLEDPRIIAQEVQKCIEGMRLADSRFAAFAPKTLKARMFVEKFKSEYKKRNDNRTKV